MRIFLVFIAILCLFAFAQAQTGIVSTIAGNGTNISSGDGAAAVSATVGVGVFGIFDRSGNYYFIEFDDHKVRQISTSGIITTVAGTGSMGYNGDNVLAVNAQLNSPQQIAVDHLGDLYIADAANQRVRKVDMSTGIITTVAGNGVSGYAGDGGMAINAELNYPSGICIDVFGDIYISDHSNYIIRKVNSSGLIATYAGIPGSFGYSGDGGPALSAKFIDIKRLCSDSEGNIYVIDGNVRKIEKTTQIINTVAGNSTSGYNGDNIPASTAALNDPLAITTNLEDELVIADRKNNRVRKVDAGGFIQTIVGTGSQGFNGDGAYASLTDLNWPEGVAFDSCGNLFFNDMLNFRIRKVTFHPDCWPTNVNEVSELSFNVYPNPASDRVVITSQSKLMDVTIVNAIGQEVLRQQANNERTEVDVRMLASGVYFVTVSDVHGGRVTKKIILNRDQSD